MKKTAILILISVICLLCCGCGSRAPKQSDSESLFTSLDHFEHANIGVMTGSLAGQIGEERFPDAQILYFNSYPDMTIALQQRTIDGFLFDLPRVILMMQETPGITYIPEEINRYEYALGYSKTLSPEISSRLNAFVSMLAESGKLKEM